jgi:hypothetical protein
MIKQKQINNVIVEPISFPRMKKKILGAKLFPQESANILLYAPKNSGKTICVKKIIEECAGKDTHVIIFCATVHQDKVWLQIKEDLQKRKIKYTAFTSIFKDKINVLEVLIQTLQGEDAVEEFEDTPTPQLLKQNQLFKFEDPEQAKPSSGQFALQTVDCAQMCTGSPGNRFPPLTPVEQIQNKKPKKKKYLAPDYMIIFDDLSTELKNPSISKLMKIHRHFSSKIIISTQSWIDTDPRIRKGNLDYVLIFQNVPEQVLEQIYKELSLTIPFGAFKAMYADATAEKYHFLYIDRNGTFRKDFNKEYLIVS